MKMVMLLTMTIKITTMRRTQVAQLVKLIAGSSVASWRKALTVLIVIIAYTTGLGDRLSLHI